MFTDITQGYEYFRRNTMKLLHNEIALFFWQNGICDCGDVSVLRRGTFHNNTAVRKRLLMRGTRVSQRTKISDRGRNNEKQCRIDERDLLMTDNTIFVTAFIILLLFIDRIK